MATSPALSPRLQLGKALRERFLAEADKAMVEISGAVMTRLTELVDEPCSARESQVRRDVWTAYKKARPLWVDSTMRQWRDCLEPPKVKKAERTLESAGLELVGTEVVENKILASRLVLSVNEKVLSELDDLRVRMKYLENIEDLDGRDVLRPEVLVLLLVEQWAQSGMPGDAWPLVNDVVQRGLIERLRTAYKNANAILIDKGVLPTIELKDRVKAPPRPLAGARPIRPAAAQPPGAVAQADPAGNQPADAGFGAQQPQSAPGGPYADSGAGGSSAIEPSRAGGFFGGRLGWGSSSGGSAQRPASAAPTSGPQSAPQSSSTPFWKQSGSGAPGQSYSAAEETRMMTTGTPLARARVRAQGVIGQIKRIFVSSAGPEYAGTVHHQPSPALAQALSPQVVAAGYAAGGTLYEDYSPAGVARVAGDLREKTAELKKKAESKGEKATIEIVALMFQAILSEERIPPGIRVWFARLQMPVLRGRPRRPRFFRHHRPPGAPADRPYGLLCDGL